MILCCCFIFSQDPTLSCPPNAVNYQLRFYRSNELAFHYQTYQFTHRAAYNRSLVFIGMTHNQSYWSVDDIYIQKLNTDTTLIINGGFESGSLAPFSLCVTNTVGASGSVYSGYAKTGSYSFLDNAKAPYDAIWQSFATVPGQDYVVTFSVQNYAPGPNMFFVYMAGMNITGSSIFCVILSSRSYLFLF